MVGIITMDGATGIIITDLGTIGITALIIIEDQLLLM